MLRAVGTPSYNAILNAPIGHSTYPTIDIIGDSITYQNDDFGGDMTTITSNRKGEAQGYLTWARFLSKQAYQYNSAGGSDVFTGGNFGIGGDTTTDVLARFTPILNSPSKIAIVLIGTNNLVNTSMTYASMVADLTSIYEQLTAKGKYVVAIPILPRSVWSSLTAPQILTARNLQNKVNRFIRNYPKLNSKVLVADPTTDLIDATSATGDPIAALFKDGLHPSIKGAYYIGLAIYNKLKAFFPDGVHTYTSQADAYSATELQTGNLLTNGLLTGSAGTVTAPLTGTAADSYTINRNTGSVIAAVCSKGATNLDGTAGTYQRIVITSAGAGVATEVIRMAQTGSISSANYAAGDVIEFGCEVAISGVSGNFVGIRPCMTFASGGFTTQVGDMDIFSTGTNYPNISVSGIVLSPRVTLPAGVGTMNIRFEITQDCTVVGGATVDIGRIFIRKVI